MFDCFNVRNSGEHCLMIKPLLKPYDLLNDSRFICLDYLIDYFRLCKELIDERTYLIFISWQTCEGIQVTVHSSKGIVKFLLENGVKSLLSDRCCQDDSEHYFGRQRASDRRRDNPESEESQFSLRPIAGNVQGTIGKFNDIALTKRKKIISEKL